MLEVLEDVERAINAKAYRSALALALTLPDVCGKVKFPSIGVGARYKKWYKDYVYNSYDIKQLLTPEMCYKLRCVFLHSGTSELNEKDKDQFPIFQLRISSIGSSLAMGDIHDKSGFVTVDVIYLCDCLCRAVKKFYIEYEPKEDFKEHEFGIVNTEKEGEKLQKAKEIFAERMKNKRNPQNYEELSKGAKMCIARLCDNKESGNSRIREWMKPKNNPEEMADSLEVMDYFMRNKGNQKRK